MAPGASVQSIQAIKEFRVALCKFAESARSALGEAEADLQRHASWLSDDRQRYWRMEIRKREEKHRQAKMALLAKKLAMNGRLSCVDEEKALAVAQRRFEEAQAKSAATVRWVRKLEEKIFEHKGLMQALNHALDVDVANGLAWLDRMIEALEAYVALAPPSEMLPPVDVMTSAGGPLSVHPETLRTDRLEAGPTRVSTLSGQDGDPGEANEDAGETPVGGPERDPHQDRPPGENDEPPSSPEGSAQRQEGQA